MLHAAVVGLGWWGGVLVNSVQGGQDRKPSEKIRFVAGVARDLAKYEGFADRTGLPLFDNLAEVLRDPNIHAIVLATPHSAHHAQIVAVAKAGKHVFVEKPLALTRADAASAVAACREAGVSLAVGFNRRYAPAVVEMARRIKAGEIGDLVHLEGHQSVPIGFKMNAANWRGDPKDAPAGPMTPLGIHTLDGMISLAGPVCNVHAFSERRKVSVAADDTTSMHLRFANGVTGYMASSTITGEYRRLFATGTKGWIELRSDVEITVRGLEGAPTTYRYPEVDKERALLEAFADTVAAKRACLMPADELVNGIAVLEAIVRSAATGQAVTIA